jgi:hypothetical protein
MTMHLVGPWLSTTGKKKGKQKFRNAEAAAKARMNEENWKEFMKRWGIEAEERKRNRGLKAPTYTPKSEPYRRETGPKIESLDSGLGNAYKLPDKVYTGDAMLGISVLHKSNGVPVFRQEDAVDISKMRRG